MDEQLGHPPVTTKQSGHPPVTDKKRAEKQRLAEALRANLKRRKAAAGRHATTGAPDKAADPAGDETAQGL